MFDFPKADRKIAKEFKRNFLKNVIFQSKHHAISNLEEKKSKMIELFVKRLPVVEDSPIKGVEYKISIDKTPLVEPLEDKSRVSFSSTDKKMILTIREDMVTLAVQGSIYKNYNDFISLKTSLEELYKILNIRTLERVAIRKTNIIEFNFQSDKVVPMDLARFMLDPALFSNIEHFPNWKNVKQNLSTVVYSADNYKLNLNYGLVIPKNEKSKGHVLIDIDMFKENETGIEDLFTVYQNINEEIFNVFNWALSEASINYLKQDI